MQRYLNSVFVVLYEVRSPAIQPHCSPPFLFVFPPSLAVAVYWTTPLPFSFAFFGLICS